MPATTPRHIVLACVAFVAGMLLAGTLASRRGGSRCLDEVALEPVTTQQQDRLDFRAALARVAAQSPAEHDNLVIIVVVNSGFLSMAHNFMAHARSVAPRIRNVLYVALDAACYQNLLAIPDIAAYFDATTLAAHDASLSSSQRFQDAAYNRIVMYKWALSLQVLKLGYRLLTIDADIVLLRNPLSFLAGLPSCDVSVTTDAWGPEITRATHSRYAHEGRNESAVYVNTGLLLWQPSRTTVELIESFLDPQWRIKGADDQTEFNQFLRSRAASTTAYVSLTLKDVLAKRCAQFAGLRINVLAPVLFPSIQQLSYDSKLVSFAQVPPFAIHFNYLPHLAAKKQMMSKYNLWLLPPA